MPEMPDLDDMFEAPDMDDFFKPPTPIMVALTPGAPPVAMMVPIGGGPLVPYQFPRPMPPIPGMPAPAPPPPPPPALII